MGDTSSEIGTGAAVNGGGGGMSLGSAFSFLGAGAKAGSDVVGAIGTSNADKFKAEQLEQAAQYGELKASQTNAQMTRNLAITLGNIDAVRAGAHADPTSPTGAAIRDYASNVGTEEKNIKVDSIMAQAEQDKANAAYMRSASSSALLGGAFKGIGDIASAAAPLLLL